MGQKSVGHMVSRSAGQKSLYRCEFYRSEKEMKVETQNADSKKGKRVSKKITVSKIAELFYVTCDTIFYFPIFELFRSVARRNANDGNLRIPLQGINSICSAQRLRDYRAQCSEGTYSPK
jgi:hypothetical protein